jgi:hypothetical protein
MMFSPNKVTSVYTIIIIIIIIIIIKWRYSPMGTFAS